MRTILKAAFLLPATTLSSVTSGCDLSRSSAITVSPGTTDAASAPLKPDGSAADGSASSIPDGSKPSDSDGSATPIGPIDLASSTIYSVYPAIFSADGTLAAVTSKLAQIHDVGFNLVYLLPVTSVGTMTTAPTSSCNEGATGEYGSPYEVKDYYGIDLKLGTSADLTALVSAAHSLGMHVILDEVLNHTSWDNPLITAHPEFYAHCDGNRSSVESIEIGALDHGSFTDVAQLDYVTTPDVGLRAYITNMLVSLIKTYDIDGFRFDTADDPYGPSRLIPLDFWQSLRAQLLAAKPGFVLLGEEEDPSLAVVAFDLDYSDQAQGLYSNTGLNQVANGGPATDLQMEWELIQAGATWPGGGTWPAGMMHMTLLQDWDFAEDIEMYGGAANTMAAATYNFTTSGVPLLFNGEEVGNDNHPSGDNPVTPIDWNGPNAATFLPFYTSLLKLRNTYTALQQGTTAWLTTSDPAHVVSYTRSDASGTFLVIINFSNGTEAGTVTGLTGSAWTDISPTGSPGGQTHAAPPSYSLSSYDFAVFKAE